MFRVIAATLLVVLLGGQIVAQKVKHVVLIGIDGLGANYITKEEMPTLTNLMTTGAYSMHARSVLPSSSADNWASMFMGASPELHGYTEWNSKIPEIPPRTLDQYGLFPSIYTILHDQQPKADIGVFYNWAGIGYLFPKQAVTKYVYSNSSTDDDIVQQATAYLKSNKPSLLLVYMSDPDGVGHSIGWGTPAYLQQESKTDQNIAKILAAIQDAGISDSTVVIVSADHGGLNKGHGGKTLKEMEIPWVIAGPGIKRGYEITDSIMTYDTAATIASLLKLKPPQVWIGRPVKAAFSK
ncbi:MAG TPA: alkaline phosphatase [Granulicella sp.]|jgi:predicted AlkP superfamily pyrophosphatase or phosphodiesterase